MEAKFVILFIALLATPSLAQHPINCVFFQNAPNYDCVLTSTFLPDNEELTFNIQGNHQTGMGNANVNRVIITTSNMPFVIREFFTTFVNLQQYHYTDSNFASRVQNYAFQAATNLQEITIARTANLTIFPNSFTGANALLRLNLQSNLVDNIPSGLLTGLVNLQSVDFSNNQIASIAEIFLRAQTQITTINLNNNLLTRIPNTLLGTNTNLISFSAQTNQIYQIGRLFLNSVNSLTTLSLSGNQCINQNWANIGGVGGPTKDTINLALQTCFANYQGGDFRDFGFQLRGRVRLYDEDDNLVGQL